VIDDATIDAMIDEANAREAKLGLFFCNKADQQVWAALAEPLAGNRYESRGWWKLEPGDCAKVIKGALATDHFYVYGVIEDQRGERRLTGGDKPFCVNAVRFAASMDTSCAEQELDEAIFRRVEIGGVPSSTFDFTTDAFVAPPSETPAQ
jgi:uncharacterized membrane protein